ncbi:MAG: SxtJ family membrane protein [Candidatus Eisenbacteria bacterium]
MSSESDNRPTSRKRELRKFGLTVGIAFGVLGGLLLWRGKWVYPYSFVVSAALILLGLARPVLLGPLHKGWMKVADLMGWVMTRVILIILFYAVVTPLGLLARLAGKDFLDLKFDSRADTYWSRRDTADLSEDHYERQY